MKFDIQDNRHFAALLLAIVAFGAGLIVWVSR